MLLCLLIKSHSASLYEWRDGFLYFVEARGEGRTKEYESVQGKEREGKWWWWQGKPIKVDSRVASTQRGNNLVPLALWLSHPAAYTTVQQSCQGRVASAVSQGSGAAG